VPNAVTWEGNTYARIDLKGSIKLTNRRGQKVDLEITRYVLGSVTGEPTEGGKAEMVNVAEGSDYLPNGTDGQPWQTPWWSWYNWPNWWWHFNGVGKITWNIPLEPDKSNQLDYEWNYYWR
jgi:hypothetical protein